MNDSVKNHLWLWGFVVALLPLLLMRDFTPANELRYLSIADEALRNHVFFAFTNHGVPYADKPPMYLWLVMLMRTVFGHHCMLALSALSLVPALLIVSVMNAWTCREMDEKCRLTASMMLLTSGIFIGAAITVRMDMLMSLFIVLALRSFWKIYEGIGAARNERWRFPVYVFLALFTKGALGVLIPLCATVVFLVIRHEMGRVCECWGWRTWCVLLVCCLLWWYAAYAEGGYAYLHDMLCRQTIGRALHSFHHAHPFYYYLISIWYSLAPWSLFVLFSIVSSLRQRVVKSPLQKFFLTISVSTLVLLSCISGKLQVYMLPAVPFMVYVAGMLLPRAMRAWWSKPCLMVPAGVFMLALPVLIFMDCMGYLASAPLPKTAHVMVYVSAAVLTASGAYSFCHVSKSVSGISVGFLLAVVLASPVIAVFNEYCGYAAICGEAKRMSLQAGGLPVATWKIKHAKDMDVYLGHTPIVIPDDANPDRYLSASALVIEGGYARRGWRVVLVDKRHKFRNKEGGTHLGPV